MAFDKGTQADQWSNWIITSKNKNFDLTFTPYTQFSSSWIIDLNVKLNITALLEELKGENLKDPGLDRIFRYDSESIIYNRKQN